MSKSNKVMTAQDVQRVYTDLRDEFKAINIPKPMAFIRWKRPGLSGAAQDAILMAFCGRASKKAAKYIPEVRGVLDELKAA